MKLMRSSAAFALLLVFSCACLGQDKSNATIKGKVRVERGSPSGVAVILLEGDREVSRALTDKRGEFVMSRVTPGTYSVKFRKAGLSVGTVDDVAVKAAGELARDESLQLSLGRAAREAARDE